MNFSSIKLRALLLFVLASTLVFTACKEESPTPESSDGYRGRIVSYQKDTTISKSFYQGLIGLLGIDASNISFDSDVDIYSVVYETPNYDGTKTIASGQFAIPATPTGDLRLASYQHGTLVRHIDAPSSLKEHADLKGSLIEVYSEQLLPSAFASMGYAVCAPDYLAMGDGPGTIHPYMHAQSEASSTIDLLRASRSIMAELGVVEKQGGVVLFGYSQGGHATSAAQREIEANLSDEFDMFCSLPMSGPYDLAGAQVDLMLSDEPYAVPFYLPYVLFSYDMIYDMYGGDQTQYLKPVYVDSLYTMLANRATPAEQNAAMPASGKPKEILLDTQIADFQSNDQHPLRVALELNDLKGFAPQAPTKIIYCEGDEEVPGQHGINAYNAWTNNGAPNLTIFNGGNKTHGECVPIALEQAVLFLQELENE